MAAYKDQLDRLRRWLARIENPNAHQQEHVDFLWAFFQNCWHMKDWIINDDSLDQPFRDSIEGEVRKYHSLMISADLANRSKHLDLRKIRKDAKLTGHVTVEIEESVRTGQSSSNVSWEYVVVLGDGSQHNARNLARTAVKDWEAILKGEGLPIN
jgi:hypothetical protein